MEQLRLVIAENSALTPWVYRLVLEGERNEAPRPGQFVELALPGRFLRRPISLCDWDANHLTLIYKVVGQGTDQLSRMRPGHSLDVLAGLGNGYDTACTGAHPLLVGGGVGIPPLYGLCKQLISENKEVTVILGFNIKDEIFYVNEFEALGARLRLTTADGSAGQKGFVTDALAGIEASHLCACGPMPMLRALNRATDLPGQFSLEERMGCGFGACMGCSIPTREGQKRVCKDGPVFRREVLLWEN